MFDMTGGYCVLVQQLVVEDPLDKNNSCLGNTQKNSHLYLDVYQDHIWCFPSEIFIVNLAACIWSIDAFKVYLIYKY